MEYYSLPLKVQSLLDGKRVHDEVDLKRAIHQNIRLILKSYTMSYRFDPTFGSLLSKYNAATPPQNRSERAWREKIRNEIQRNLTEMLQRYETRVDVKEVMVNIETKDNPGGMPTTTVNVEVSGRLSIGRKDKFHFPDSEVSEEAQEAFPLLIPMGRS
jgi:phage baseplate assembly protein W